MNHEGDKKMEQMKRLDSKSQPTFRPFDPDGELRVYVRNLPHWRQPGATYFVTFRQDDSIPAKVLAEWQDVRQRWYSAHGLDPSWKNSLPDRFAEAYSQIPAGARRAFEREQARMLHEELDRCHGSCVLRNAEPRHEVRKSLKHFHGERLWLGDYVVMPNHVHAIVTPFENWKLEDILASIKKWTSRLIGMWTRATDSGLDSESQATVMHNKPRFWQYESYDRIIRDEEELFNFRRYIGENPRKAKLATEAYEYAAADWLDSYAPRST